jgi:hypothetical protein
VQIQKSLTSQRNHFKVAKIKRIIKPLIVSASSSRLSKRNHCKSRSRSAFQSRSQSAQHPKAAQASASSCSSKRTIKSLKASASSRRSKQRNQKSLKQAQSLQKSLQKRISKPLIVSANIPKPLKQAHHQVAQRSAIKSRS